jgi:predicted nucleic acid-binding protein
LTLIVSDNSPLNVIVRVDAADILPRLFERVLIPPEVAVEMAHPKAPKATQTFIAAPPPWLEIRAPSSPLFIPELDPGESAAISLAIELQAALMIDEREGRRIARQHGLTTIGAIGILERGANEGLIIDLADIHARIRSARFHVSDVILKASLARHLAFRANHLGT